MKNNLIIGTRGSKLALTQSNRVRDSLSQAHPHLTVHVEIIKTTGDKLKTAPLSLIGGQGVFTKEIQDALLDERIDLAVHSLKDLPTVTPEALTLAAIPAREDARDALVLPLTSPLVSPLISSTGNNIAASSLAALPQGAMVGTSSMRRAAQLKYVRPDIRIKELRGNVDTRLRLLDEGQYDAIILAAAGLNRLGLSARISLALNPLEMLPAIGQGALGLECRASDTTTRDLLTALDDVQTHAACIAERALLRHLGGGCQLPIAGHALVFREMLHLQGLVANPSGTRVLRSSCEGTLADAARLGETLAHDLLAQGAQAFITSAIL